MAKKEKLSENEIKNGEFSLVEVAFSGSIPIEMLLYINYFGYGLVEPKGSQNFEHGQFIECVEGIRTKVIEAYKGECEDVDREMKLWKLKYRLLQKYFMSRAKYRFIQAVISSVMWKYGSWYKAEALAYPSHWWGKEYNVDNASNFAIRELIANKKLKIRRAWHYMGKDRVEYPKIDCCPPYDNHSFSSNK